LIYYNNWRHQQDNPISMENLEKMDISDPNSLQDWFERFEIYSSINQKITPENKTTHFLTMIGKEAYHLVRNLAYPESVSKKSAQSLYALLREHLLPANYEINERTKFHSIKRHPDEKYKEFLLRIQIQASKCNFGNHLEIQIRDRIAAGINNTEIQQKLLREKDLTYHKARNIVQEYDDLCNSTTIPVLQVSRDGKYIRKEYSQNRFSGLKETKNLIPGSKSDFVSLVEVILFALHVNSGTQSVISAKKKDI